MVARTATKPRAPVAFSEDDWQQRATAAAIGAARKVVAGDAVNSRTPVGSLSEFDWGWIISAGLFGWIACKAEQATHEGTGAEITIRSIRGDPDAWEAGSVQAILPALSEVEVDWSKPLGEWPREAIVKFAWAAHKLVDAALAARDEGAICSITKDIRADVTARQVNGAAGNPLVAPDEMNDAIPF
jgi:hypothetical protein